VITIPCLERQLPLLMQACCTVVVRLSATASLSNTNSQDFGVSGPSRRQFPVGQRADWLKWTQVDSHG